MVYADVMHSKMKTGRGFNDAVLDIYVNHITDILRLQQSVNSRLRLRRGYCFQKSNKLVDAICQRQ